jgi:hypothetical protein
MKLRVGRSELAAVVGILVLSVGFQVLGGIITYTSRDAWTAALQGNTNFGYDFNNFQANTSFAQTPLLFNAINFNNSHATVTMQASVQGGPSPANGNLVSVPTITPLISVGPGFSTPNLVLYGDGQTNPLLKFLSPFTAVGFDYQILSGNPQIEVIPTSGGPVTIPFPATSGFLGMISDTHTPFNAINFQVPLTILAPGSVNPTADSNFYLAIDNVEGVATPEPVALTLVLTGGLSLAGYGCWRWRRGRSRSAGQTPTQ